MTLILLSRTGMRYTQAKITVQTDSVKHVFEKLIGRQINKGYETEQYHVTDILV